MKQKFGSVFLLTALFGLIIFSCRKENSKSEQNQTNSETLERTIAWLDIQQQKFKDTTSQKTLASLKENLIGSQISTEVLNDKERIIIIPLKDEFKTINVTNQRSLKNLVIIEGEDNELKLSNIIEIIPKNQHYDEVPANLISNIYNNKDNELNGIVSILSLTNKFMREREYKNGKLYSIGYLKKKENSKGSKESESLKTNGCIDWYWMYYVNGVLVYEEYAFTTCSGDECQTTRTIDSPTPFKINCGGGGGSYNNEVIENVSSSDSEAQYIDADGINTGGNVGIGYTYNATIARIASTREITSVVVDPITANPMYANYIDNYGRSVTRSLTLFGHNNSYTLLSAISVMINWSCFVYARYTYTDGSPEFSRQWSKSKSSVY